MRNSSSLDWLRFMHTPNDYRVSQKNESYKSTLTTAQSENWGDLMAAQSETLGDCVKILIFAS